MVLELVAALEVQVEYVIYLTRRNTDTRIAYRDDGRTVRLDQRYPDQPVRRREFLCVIEQVHDRLAQTYGIAPYGNRALRDMDLKRDPTLVRKRRVSLYRLPQKLAE